MRRLIAALFALCIWANPAFATVALVAGQTISGNGSFGATTDVLVLPNNPTTNNLVVCGFQSSVHTTMSVADANSNSYTATTKTPLTGAGGFFGIFYFVATGTASKTITLTDTGNSSGFINGCASDKSAEFQRPPSWLSVAKSRRVVD